MDEQQEIIQEFLVESNEMLTQLDQDFIELEQRPEDADLLSSIFRTIHTIKGACGFLGFSILEAITHRAENLLSQLRDGERKLTPELTTLLLETFDVVRGILVRIEETSGEGDDAHEDLVSRLQTVCDQASDEPGTPESDAAAQLAALEAEQLEALRAAKAKKAAEEKAPDEADAKDAGVAETGVAETGASDAPAPADAGAAKDADVTRKTTKRKDDGEHEDHPAHRSAIADSNIRVSVDLLDGLMNLVGELVLARNQILQYAESREDGGFSATSQRLNLITTELQANVMKTRMQPIRLVWNKLPRVVRDLGSSFGKRIELQMEGADTELDKTIIEAIKDPLTHIVRNSCDHGIETPEQRLAAGKPAHGVLSLRAFHEGGQVNIEIADDGAGIDPNKIKQKAIDKGTLTAEQAARMSDREALNLVFAAGFSTAQQVTNVSGRGVGMDVVRTNIERIGGSLELQSEVGKGAVIRIKIPLTLAIIPALVVTCSGERFAIPQVNLVELVRVDDGHSQGETGATQGIEWIHGTPVYRLRGKLLPLVYLNEAVKLPTSEQSQSGSLNIVVVQADERSFGLVVDSVQDTAEIVVKPLGKLLKSISVYAGATIMGDGHVALILDVMGLARAGRVIGDGHAHSGEAPETTTVGSGEQAVLLFRAGSMERLAVPLGLVDRLEEFTAERIETSGGRPAVQYRNRILPLIPLAERLGDGAAEISEEHAAQVLVFSKGQRRAGLIVDEILDIVDERIEMRPSSGRDGVIGSSVVDGKITDFVDIQSLLEQTDRRWFEEESTGGSARLMLMDDSAFSRGLLRQRLEVAGYEVFEARDPDEAIRRIRELKIGVVAASLDWTGDVYALSERIRRQPDLSHVRVVGLAESEDEAGAAAEREDHLDICLARTDHASVLASIEQLAAATSETEALDTAPAA